MNEASFIRKVNARVAKCYPDIYALKTHDSLNAGIPDVYYEGIKQILWAEYKFIQTMPVARHKPALSMRQKEWLRRAYEKGIKTLVIVGTPTSALVYTHPEQWECSTKINELKTCSHNELASYINGVMHEF